MHHHWSFRRQTRGLIRSSLATARQKESLEEGNTQPSHKHSVPRDSDDGVVLTEPQSRPVAAAASASVSAVRAHIGHDAVAGQEQDEAMHAATQSTLLELLSNPAVHPSSVHRFLVAFPLPECMPPRQRLLLARQCWEHLLDNRDPDRMEHVYGKMELLRNIKLHCPTELFRQHCHLEQVQLLVDAMGSQVKVGNFLCQLRRCLSVEGQHTFRHESRKVQQLQIKLETADLLMVVHTLGTGNVLSINAEQLQQLKLVHLARHGPVSELESVLRIPEARQQHEGSSAAAAADPLLARKLVNASYQGFPILFQPLIECHKGWLERLEFLLRAGANAATVYEPWNSTALHMLFYQKLHKVKEAHQVRAIHLLMQHGAKTVLNLMDKGSANSDGMSASNTPTHRTTLLQAASAGRFQACRVLLTAGADADVVDSSNQSMLDYLFYQKHSNWNIHRRATADFTCMQLYGLVNEFRLHDLVSDELEQDCRSCGRCRFLLASCASVRDDDSHSSSSSESEHSLKDSSSSDSDMEDDRERHHAITSEEHVKPTFLID